MWGILIIMSKIAKNPILVPEGTSCTFENDLILIKGKLGEMKIKIPNIFEFINKDNEVKILPKDKNNESNPLWGTLRAHLNNAVKGVNEGFTKTLELNGTGYRASVSGNLLKLQLGYSHDIKFEFPKDVKIECPKQDRIKISSFNKELLGIIASKIRSFRKPEPFKGKGIKYNNEFIFRKEGKKK